MNRKDVKISKRARPFDGYFKVDRYTVKHRLFEGGWSSAMTREVFERGHAVVVVLYDADLDKLVFIEQFRIGAHAAAATPWFDREFSPWLIECVAGIIGDGEAPEDVACREALEEAGCEVRDIIPVFRIFTSPGASTESVFIYCARIDASNAGGIHGLSEEHENIRVHAIPAAEAFKWLDAGRILQAATIIGIQWFRDHHKDLRARWRMKTSRQKAVSR